MLSALPLPLSITINALAAACLVVTLVFSLVLIRKYRVKRSAAVRYLTIGFLIFVVAGIIAIPIAFTSNDIIKKWIYMVAKILLTIVSIYFTRFIISIFSPGNEGSPRVRRLLIAFLAGNVALIVAYHLTEISLLITDPGHDKYTILWMLPVQGFALAIPFVWLGILAFKVAKRDNVIRERRAIQFIAISGFSIALFFGFNAVNDAIGTANPWTLPAWIAALVAIASFYIGLVRPAFIFGRYETQG